MATYVPTLHLLCGKIASGKSTLAEAISQKYGAVSIAEDTWLHALYSDQMSSISDYVHCAAKLRNIIGPHVVSLLNKGASVVLDFHANSKESRNWMQDILAQTSARHKLHFLDVSDEVCLTRLRARNAAGDHPFAPTEEQFHQISAHFEMPTGDEGFNIERHQPDDI